MFLVCPNGIYFDNSDIMDTYNIRGPLVVGSPNWSRFAVPESMPLLKIINHNYPMQGMIAAPPHFGGIMSLYRPTNVSSKRNPGPDVRRNDTIRHVFISFTVYRQKKNATVLDVF